MAKRFPLATAHAHLSSCQPRRGGQGRQCGSVSTIASSLGIRGGFWLLKPGPFASFLPVVVQIQTVIVPTSGGGSPQNTWRWEATSSRDRASGLRPEPLCGLLNLALPPSLGASQGDQSPAQQRPASLPLTTRGRERRRDFLLDSRSCFQKDQRTAMAGFFP